ncbi:MAG: Holliday junction resolvase RuvX [Candidatus Gracilibacteria bacterium]|nr:Holliday junction resolvase RuvX [Candidatus Gracilibacteria bacterium]
MSTLAIDYGTKKIGLAIAVEEIAFPIAIIATKEAFSRLPKIVKERGINTIVIGIANHMDGTTSEQAIRTREFQKKLQNILPKDIQYIEWDERLTTFEAKNSMDPFGKDPRKAIDDVAASIFLQSYLDSTQKSKNTF